MWCSVINCSNCNTKKEKLVFIGFHAFPKCPILFKKWIHFCGRKDKINPKTARICSTHFVDDDFQNNLQFKMGFSSCRILKSDAVPSVRCESSKVKDSMEDSPVLKDSNRSKRLNARTNREMISSLLKNDEPESEIEPIITEQNLENIYTNKCIQTDFSYINDLNLEIETLMKENNLLKEAADKHKEEMIVLKKDLEKLQYQKDNMESKLLFIFSPGQVTKLKNGIKKLNWKEADIAQSITLYSASQRGYKLLRKKGFPLPAIRTLQRWSQQIDISPGILKPVLQILKSETQLNDAEKVCVISFDEMKIKEVYCYDKSSDTTYKPACYVQVAMLRGLMSKWKQPIFYSYDCKMTKDILFMIIKAVADCGFPIVAVTSDLGGGNRGLHKELDVTMNKPWFTYETKKIYVFADVPHLIKLLRNHFIDTGFIINGKSVKKDIIVKLLGCASTNELSILHKISSHHLNVAGAERQKVKLATKLFSHTVAKALSRSISIGRLDDDNWEECYNLFKLTNDWFDIMNTRVYAADSRERVNAYGLSINIQNEILDRMTEMMSTMRVIGKNVLLPFQKGIMQSNLALKLLLEDLKETYKFQYILTYRLNQDVLENFFSVMRSKGGLHDHPDRQEFKFRMRSYILGYNEGSISGTGNVGSDDTPDLEGSLTGSILKIIMIEPVQPIEEQCLADKELESLEYDGLENMAGYICHKLKETVPNIVANTSEAESSYTWVNHVSEGGLSKPTCDMMAYINVLENIFKSVNGDKLKICINYLQNLSDTAETIDCDEKIKKLFFRSRMFFRIRTLNKELIDKAKSKSRKRKFKKIVT